jgi:hypothetical protein
MAGPLEGVNPIAYTGININRSFHARLAAEIPPGAVEVQGGAVEQVGDPFVPCPFCNASISLLLYPDSTDPFVPPGDPTTLNQHTEACPWRTDNGGE